MLVMYQMHSTLSVQIFFFKGLPEWWFKFRFISWGLGQACEWRLLSLPPPHHHFCQSCSCSAETKAKMVERGLSSVLHITCPERGKSFKQWGSLPFRARGPSYETIATGQLLCVYWINISPALSLPAALSLKSTYASTWLKWLLCTDKKTNAQSRYLAARTDLHLDWGLERKKGCCNLLNQATERPAL